MDVYKLVTLLHLLSSLTRGVNDINSLNLKIQKHYCTCNDGCNHIVWYDYFTFISQYCQNTSFLNESFMNENEYKYILYDFIITIMSNKPENETKETSSTKCPRCWSILDEGDEDKHNEICPERNHCTKCGIKKPDSHSAGCFKKTMELQRRLVYLSVVHKLGAKEDDVVEWMEVMEVMMPGSVDGGELSYQYTYTEYYRFVEYNYSRWNITISPMTQRRSQAF